MSQLDDVLDAEITFPPRLNRAAVLAPAYHSAWRMPGRAGAEYRRVVTHHDPLMFMLTYFGHYLLDPVTGTISFSKLHLYLCRRIARWAVRDAEDRDAVAAPRDFAKSTYGFLLGPAWAMAHQHRRFPLAFSFTGDQAAGQLRNLAHELEHNRLLLADFPGMRIARGRGTRTGGGVIATESGAAVGARGLRESSLGTRAMQHRPDVLIGDDLEPLGGLSSEGKADVLQTLVAGVLPMGRGPALLLGTTVGYGSLLHDVVSHALGRPLQGSEWVAAEGFRPAHFPALEVTDRGEEVALWPQRRSVEWLRERRDSPSPETRWTYSLNYALDPRPEVREGMTYWTDELIRYDPRADPDVRVLFVDVATTHGRRSDLTVVVVVGYEQARRRAVVEHADVLPGGEVLPLQERLWHYRQRYPRTLHRGAIETNQGGDLWLRGMSLPPGLEMRQEHAMVAKDDRIRLAHGHYARGAVVHAQRLPELEQQMRDWGARSGRIVHDDLVDALAGALAEVFTGELIS